MRIAELIAVHARLPLRKTIRHASHTRDANDTLLVCCRLENGIEGWGEALPRPYVTGETIATAWEQFQGADFPRQLGGRIESLADAVACCDALRLPDGGRGTRDCFGNSVRCAVELSVLDAVAKTLEVPLSEVTRHVPESAAIRAAVPQVQYSGIITPMGALREVTRAGLLRLLGIRHCKVKVGLPGLDDAAALRRIRRLLGSRIDLRIDANESWSPAEVEGRLARLLPLRISVLEQPVPHAEVDSLARLRGRTPVSLMLDESLCSYGDGLRAIEAGTCDMFNIRLSKCGGFVASVRLAALAHRAGLGYQLGCMVGETGILSAAGRHFATSIAGICYREGSYDRFLMKERLTVEDLTFGYGGWADALSGSGLGARIDPRALRRVTIAEEHVRFTGRPAAGRVHESAAHNRK